MHESVEEHNNGAVAEETTRSKSDLIELVTRIEGEIERRTSAEYAKSPEDVGEIESTVFAEKQYIKFVLAEISLAVSITSALEIGRLPEITPLPNLPGWILGISNVRGDIVSIIDPKGFFGWPPQKKIRDPHFIILHNEEMRVGLLVDKISGIVSLNEDDTDIQDEPIEKTDLELKLEPYISDVSISEEKPLYVIDVDRLLSDPRMKRDAVDE